MKFVHPFTFKLSVSFCIMYSSSNDHVGCLKKKSSISDVFPISI